MVRIVRMRSILAMFFVSASISFLIIFSSVATPDFFVGMYARYEFTGEITRYGQTVYKLLSFSNWTVLDLKENSARIETEMLITSVEGLVPEPVLETFNPFPNASWKKTTELNLNQSYWGYYLNDTANDLLKHKVGEETIESQVGMIQCYHLQLRRAKQEWDAFHDKNSGIVISLQETFWVSDYQVTYNSSIVGTNAHLGVAAAEVLDYSTFLILAAVVAIIASLGFLAFKKRGKSDLNMGKEPMNLFL